MSKIKDELIKPDELLNILKRIKPINNVRLLILYLDLFIEHYIHILYKIAEKNNKIKKEFFFTKIYKFLCRKNKIGNPKQKIKRLIENDVVDKMFFEIIIITIKLRDKLVHTLKPDMKILEKHINDHKPPVIYDNKGLIKKFLENASPWEKIQLYSFPAVLSLYRRIREEKGEKIDRNIEFNIASDAKSMEMKLIKE